MDKSFNILGTPGEGGTVEASNKDEAMIKYLIQYENYSKKDATEAVMKNPGNYGYYDINEIKGK